VAVPDFAIDALVDLLPEGDWVDAVHDRAVQEGQRRRLAEIAAPDLEIAMVGPGGFTGSFSGIEGFQEAWRDWLEPFSSYTVERDPDFRRSDDAVIFFGRQVVVPKGSDSPIETEAASVFFFRDGKVRRMEFHLEPDSALRAAGLET
jgi:hypothetical protein